MSSPRPPRLSLDQVRQDGLVELAAAAAAVSSSGTSTGTMAPPSGPGPGLELDLFSLDLRGLEQQFARAAKMSATQLRTALASAAAAAPAVESGWADEEESSRSVAVAADVLRVQRAAAGCRAALREQGEVVVAIERQEHARHLGHLCARASALIDRTRLREAADMLSALQTDSSAAHASQIAGRVEGLGARMGAAAVQLLGRSFVVGGAGDDEDQAMVAFEFRSSGVMEAAHCLGDAWAAHSTALNQALSEAILTPVVRGRGELRILEEEEEEEEEGICRAEIACSPGTGSAVDQHSLGQLLSALLYFYGVWQRGGSSAAATSAADGLMTSARAALLASLSIGSIDALEQCRGMCAAAFRDAAAMASAQGGGAEDALERLETDVMAELEKSVALRYTHQLLHRCRAALSDPSCLVNAVIPVPNDDALLVLVESFAQQRGSVLPKSLRIEECAVSRVILSICGDIAQHVRVLAAGSMMQGHVWNSVIAAVMVVMTTVRQKQDEFACIPCYSAIQYNNLSFVEAVLKRLVLLYPPRRASGDEIAARIDKLRAQLVAQASGFLSHSFEHGRRDIEQAMADLDALDGTDNKKQYETSEKAIRQIRHQLESLLKALVYTLSHRVLLCIYTDLLESVVSRVVALVMTRRSINLHECDSLAALIKVSCQAWDLRGTVDALPDNEEEEEEEREETVTRRRNSRRSDMPCPSWRKLQLTKTLLDSNLIQIEKLWKGGSLREAGFEAKEVQAFVCAVFEDTPKRSACLDSLV